MLEFGRCVRRTLTLNERTFALNLMRRAAVRADEVPKAV
jgi:hypothetical protein